MMNFCQKNRNHRNCQNMFLSLLNVMSRFHSVVSSSSLHLFDRLSVSVCLFSVFWLID